MTQIKIADDFNLDAPPPGAAPIVGKPPAADAKAAPVIPGAAQAGPIRAMSPKSKHVERMQNLMLQIRKEFFSSNFKDQSGLPSHTPWDNFATSMFQRHLDHNASQKSEPFVNKLESIGLIGTTGKSNPKDKTNYGGGPTPEGDGQRAEPKADGVWGDKTNAGLKSIYDLATMMFSIANKFQIGLHFTDQDVAKIRDQIPKDTSKIENIDGRADQISESLTKIVDSVATFLTSVEQSMRTNREESEVAAGYDGRKENTKATFPGVGRIQLNSKQFTAPIALSHFFTKEQFIQFLTANKINIDVKSDEALSNYLTSLEEGINSGTITLTMGNDPKILQTSR